MTRKIIVGNKYQKKESGINMYYAADTKYKERQHYKY